MDNWLKDKLDKLEHMRKAKGLTTEKFAEEELGITRQGYYNWLNGERKPDYDNLRKIMKYLEG